jgi:Phage uncharacterised protein (Phage_XkdX)
VFEMTFWQTAYQYGWATKSQLKEAVVLGDLTAEEYQQITGEPYTA